MRKASHTLQELADLEPAHQLLPLFYMTHRLQRQQIPLQELVTHSRAGAMAQLCLQLAPDTRPAVV
jgi:hypothetical protein